LWGKGVIERGRALGASLSGRRFVAHAGQFIASRIDVRNGAMGLVPESLDGALVTNDFPLFNLNTELMEPAFLGWLCHTADFVESCLRASEGTTNRVRLKEAQFLTLEIPLPPLVEQRRIVERIEELSAQIQEARALRQQADEEAKELWERGASKIFDHVNESYPDQPLANLVVVRGGGTPSKSNPFYWDGNIPWITPKDMKRRELSDAIDHISECATQESSAKLIEPGAVLVVVRGMILAHTVPSAILRTSATINQDMKALIPKKGLLPEFLCSLFWAKNAQILELVSKSTHDTRKFETSKLMKMRIIVPPLPEQRRIVAELDALQAQVNALKQLQTETAAELDALLPAILDHAFKGEL
jgi:type I restriction enzyme S subunit